jgi:ribonuclease P protein component
VVGKRIGKAVQRNRAKRRVREVVRRLFDRIASGMDLVFVVRTTEVIDMPSPRLQAAVEALLQRAGVWRGHSPGTRN